MILPTAMRIQDDIPTELGRRITRNDDAEVVQIRKFFEKEGAVRAFEVKKHELSEKTAEPAAGGWIPWDGRAESGPKEAVVAWR